MKINVLILAVFFILLGIQVTSYAQTQVLEFEFDEDVTIAQDDDYTTQSTTLADTTDIDFFLRLKRNFQGVITFRFLVDGDIAEATMSTDTSRMLFFEQTSAALYTFTIPRSAITEEGDFEFTITTESIQSFAGTYEAASITLTLSVLSGEGKIPDRIIQIVGGNEQEEFVGNSLPFYLTVEVINEATWEIYSNVVVTYGIIEQPEGNSGAFLTNTSVLTDADGRARTVLHLGDTIGQYRIEASISDSDFDRVVFIATAILDDSVGVAFEDTESLDSIESLSQTTTTTDTEDVTYKFLLTNTGISNDTFDLTLTSDIENLTLSPTNIELEVDESQEVTLIIPRDDLTDVGTYDVIVTAISRNDITKVSEISIKTIVTILTDDGPTEVDLQLPLYAFVFSEFMFESEGGDDGLPQWIEVYNNSSSEKNLRGWKLQWKRLKPTLLDVTTTFQEDYIIPAQQSRLIVTSLGRHAGNINLSNDVVYQLDNMHPEELAQDNIENRNHLITRGGFSLKLLSPNDVLIDHISNLKQVEKLNEEIDDEELDDEELDDQIEWKLPLCLIDGIRTSVIRRFDEGIPREGTLRRGWRRAVDSKNLIVGNYYGNPNDLGTPGYRRGKPLPVELSHFSARLSKNEVVVNWVTESEFNNAGFNILRSTSPSENFTKINTRLIQGAGTTGERNEYQFIDKTAKPNVVYYYRIEDIDISGTSEVLKTQRLQGLVSPTNKVIINWGSLKTNSKAIPFH
ncbi:lamin tail domain-containing protein [Candidatus Poribacteria bacterium]|nr:lamin tail domain-containing protein [Candidatus Poribacteria bacterium]